jgi:hypothetical protein
MSPTHDETALCGQVLDRLVEGDDLSGERLLAEHLGSCVTCFRALTELRDTPRLAEALRAEAPVSPPPNDRFWDDLAARTTAAAQSELERTRQAAPGSAETRAVAAPASVDSLQHARARRSSVARARIISVAATLAAAAGFMLVARGPSRSPSAIPASPATLASTARSHPTAPAVRTAADEATTDEETDVADVDAGTLRRLLDRMRPRAPAALTAPAGGGAVDSADVVGDDEGRVNDELADLDGDELRRVVRSFEAGRL